MYSTTTYTKVLSVVKAWPWKLEEWNAATCFSVCSILKNGFGVRYMKKEYLDRGVDLDESLFGELVNEWNGARDTDVANWNQVFTEEKELSELSDKQRVSIADGWLWDKKLLKPEVRRTISKAYDRMGRQEETTAWLVDVDK